MKSVFLRRKGHAVRGFDSGLGRGFEAAAGGEVQVSELAALELQRDDPDGWELARTEVEPEPAQPEGEVSHGDH